MRCAQCKWWDKEVVQIEGQGACRKLLPVHKFDEEYQYDYWLWPGTLATDWCGQFEPTVDLSVAWDDFCWCIRVRKSLEEADIHSTEDLIRKRPSDLLQIRNFGMTSLREVRRKLADVGLTLLQ